MCDETFYVTKHSTSAGELTFSVQSSNLALNTFRNGSPEKKEKRGPIITVLRIVPAGPTDQTLVLLL
jgi:hypothetical protein